MERLEEQLREALRRIFEGRARESDPERVRFELHMIGYPEDGEFSFSEVVRALWGQGDGYFLVVDLFEKQGSTTMEPTVFCRPSGHPKRPWEGTWDPNDLGPFRILGNLKH